MRWIPPPLLRWQNPREASGPSLTVGASQREVPVPISDVERRLGELILYLAVAGGELIRVFLSAMPVRVSG
jgi:hypothetical protein